MTVTKRDASSMFKCGEFPNAPSWEFLAYIVTAGAQTLPSECADVMLTCVFIIFVVVPSCGGDYS